MGKNFVDEINQKTMRMSVADYALLKTLSSPEQAALNVCIDDVKGKPILDLGVGGGRTVEALNAISADYVGIDYVEEMVAVCRKRFPEVRFKHADARSLTEFQDRSFALVFFACNGVSMVDHIGRLAILKEIYRLLTPGGFFIFSTYNRKNLRYRELFQFPAFSFTNNPVKLAARSARFLMDTAARAINRIRFKSYEEQKPEYAMINDVCHNYATMLYYISPNDQRRQLETIGFLPHATAFDLTGDRVTRETQDDSLTYIARKPF
ncbi:MAG: class I SAM-dependent methyltransferase [Nitrospirae bacterium]|nr:class I SAM-dependent methyltransferase [Candidatus Manganitrophaceae bacterium]